MKRIVCLTAVILSSVGFTGCSKNHYKFTFKVLHENTQPADGFMVDAWVKGKCEPKTIKTGPDGIAEFTDLPMPDTMHQVVSVLHYYNGAKDGARKITYPYLESDAVRMKDTQYIPNPATPNPQ